MKTRLSKTRHWSLVIGHSALLAALFLLGNLCAQASQPPTIVLVGGEEEYDSTNTLPAFARFLETDGSFKCVFLARRATNDIPGVEALARADLLILFTRRNTLPPAQLQQFKDYFESGRPVIGLRTASHAFQNWLEFDHLVLGGNYQGHQGNALIATAYVNPEAGTHPILKGVAANFITGGSLYRNTPLGSNTTVLLFGEVPGKPAEPLAWTHSYRGGRVFYTSLGHPKDFEEPAFHRMLHNAVLWALGQPGSSGEKPAGPVLAPRRISVDEFDRLRQQPNQTILDVRTPREFTAGHVPGATNINVLDSEFEARAGALDKAKPCLVYCARGGRSAMAAQKLHSLGFREVLDFGGGWNVWAAAGKPAEK